jgi:ATP-dependent DNA ligase
MGSVADLPLAPPQQPMLARLERTLPHGDGWLYEPKWDGFRCLAFRSGGDVALTSRNERRLERYFPDVAGALLGLSERRFVLDGELLAHRGGELTFDALLSRIHPTASFVARLAEEEPAFLVAFDVLALGSRDLRDEPFEQRRRRLEELLDADTPGIELTPATTDRDVAEAWLERTEPGIDGVVAKRLDEPYRPGVRAMTKVKRLRTADCVVGGVRVRVDDGLPSALLLGVHDDAGELLHVGVASSFSKTRREELAADLARLVTPLEGHPWEHGFLLEGGRAGRLPGAAGRWAPGMTPDWIPVVPEAVCEVSFDRLDGLRFRHPARFVRWRPDVAPESCTTHTLAAAVPTP